jgi:hypothetical protein
VSLLGPNDNFDIKLKIIVKQAKTYFNVVVTFLNQYLGYVFKFGWFDITGNCVTCCSYLAI